MTDWLASDVAVVTGGASGNGREISCTLAEYGADVVVADLRMEPREGGQPTTELIESEYGQRAEFVECDVTDSEDLQRTFDAAETLGGVSILVNNAGITENRDFLDETEADFDRIIDINVKAPFFASQLAAERMIDADHDGRIVNIASISGIAGRGNGVVYSASKGALRLMTYALSASLGPRGIRVNDVSPGVIETSMTRNDLEMFDSGAAEEYATTTPIGRVGTPNDVANAVLYLVSPLAGFVNGETLVVDGGATNSWGGIAGED
ncbi:SDR family oxidoreductase [Halomarina halobia]|uniref:SDR family oxidoreductase n=1 Tax=Halomarina halobia TaxID=3033386 RepID=A0ABD6AF44_9EURY|nr:SDR family oxidoreductase [Halomarina sp. PSR21]